MPRRGISRSAGYGQACMSCVKTKCRCVPRPDDHACERCHRLRKQCRPAEAVRKPAADGKQNSHKRIAELEGRLTNLVSLLQSRKVLDSDTPASTDGNDEDDTELDHAEVGDDCEENTIKRPQPAMPPPLRSTTAAPVEPSSSVAANYLDKFRSSMLPYLPFIHLPVDLTAQQLRSQRPFLFSAIVCVASQSVQEKRLRSGELKRAIAEAFFLEQRDGDPGRTDRTMDLLLGLLTYIAWGWDHVLNHGSLSRLMMLAMTLVGELRLDRPEHNDAYALSCLASGPKELHTIAGARLTTQLVLERRRAVLGCFILSSAVAAFFTEVDAMRWTPQLAVALEALSADKDCVSDTVLASQIRLQLLLTRAVEVCDDKQVVESEDAMQIGSLVRQAREIRASLVSDAGKHDEALLAYTYFAELCISDAFNPASNPSHDPYRLPYLGHAVIAIKNCASVLLAPLPAKITGISFLQWAQLSRCVVVLRHIALLDSEHWDLGGIKAVIDISALLDSIVEKLDLAASEAGQRNADDVVPQLAQRMRQFCTTTRGRESENPPITEVVVRTQNGYFKNPRFWLEQYF